MHAHSPVSRRNRHILFRLLPYYRPYTAIFVSDLLAVAASSAIALAIPYVLKVVVDSDIPQADFRGILRAGALVAVLVAAKFGASYYSLYMGHVMAVQMERDMRRDLFHHLTTLPFRFFDDRKPGELLSRVTNDIEKVSDAVNHAPEDVFLSALLLSGSYVMLFILFPPLALISLIPVPFMLAYSGILGGRIRRKFQRINDSVAEIVARMENIIAGIRIVKSFAREADERKRFARLNDGVFRAWRGSLNTLGWFYSGIDTMRDVARLIIIIAGALFVVSGRMTIGTLVAFLVYVSVYLDPIERLARTVEMFQRMSAGVTRFFEIMDVPGESYSRGRRLQHRGVRGEVQFDNVSFSYDGGAHVFRSLDLTVAAGSTVALVGPSGAGKSTFCNLIPRFYEPQSGVIRIDGLDVGEIELRSLREIVGTVSQDVFLFTGTIRENIAYGNLEVDRGVVESAARAAGAHEFITRLPGGYETDIGEKGVKLSGGQKQRISIARAFVKDPRILILDEATSALDSETERAVQGAIRRLTRGRTTIIIAHRLSTVRHADEIIVLTEAGIVERGTHETLTTASGLYSRLYATQAETMLSRAPEAGE